MAEEAGAWVRDGGRGRGAAHAAAGATAAGAGARRRARSAAEDATRKVARAKVVAQGQHGPPRWRLKIKLPCGSHTSVAERGQGIGARGIIVFLSFNLTAPLVFFYGNGIEGIGK